MGAELGVLSMFYFRYGWATGHSVATDPSTGLGFDATFSDRWGVKLDLANPATIPNPGIGVGHIELYTLSGWGRF